MVGWDWETQRTFTFGSDYLDLLQWLGTSDPAAFLAVPDAIQFQADHDRRSPPCRLKPICRTSNEVYLRNTGSRFLV
ncbi:MAG TPA: hypothetical protein VLE70_03435 [Anaerolineae bacterium]|nr:hypothetical protein [Anaerolineae bacterium]